MNMNKLFLLVGIVLLLVTVSFIGASFIEREYVLLNVRYDGGVFELQSTSLEKGNYPTINHDLDDEYKVDLFSGGGDLLYSRGIDPSGLFVDLGEGELEGGIIQLSSVEFSVVVPSLREGNNVLIKDKDGNIVLDTEVYNVGAKSCRIR
jgi:hypothetical protein